MKKLLLSSIAICTVVFSANAQCNPIITCPANISTTATSGQCGTNVTYTATAVNGCPTGTVTVFSEDFTSGGTNWTLNVNTGTNAATQPNQWEVNASEGGVTPPGCGVASNGNNTLHITCTSLFCGSLITGAVYNAGKQTNKRAESPIIVTTGYSGMTLKFNFISMGDGVLDNASVWYNDGSGWQQLSGSIKSSICGGGQGQWTAYSASLPASCDNKPAIQIAINWTNNADNIGTDPSVAVDDIVIEAPGGSGAAPTITYSPVSGSFFPIGTTTVTATATDASSNTSSCNFTVTVADNELPVISNCPASFTVTANNANCTAIANWTTPTANDNCTTGLNLSASSNSGSVFPLGTTAVTYTATDASSNSVTCTFSVTVVNDLQSSIAGSNDPLCNGGTDGSITASASGGTTAYSYSWLPSGGNSATATGLASGNYTCTVTDANGCTSTSSAALNNPAAIAGSQTLSICSGQSLTVGTSTYTSSGTYTDILTAANGCDSTLTTDLTVMPAPALNVSNAMSAVECEGSTDTLVASGAVSYSWNSGSTDDTLIITHTPGITSWTVTGTGANGCTDTSVVSITNVSALLPVSLDLNIIDTLCVTDGGVSLIGIGTPVGGAWNGNGISGNSFFPAMAGIGTHPLSYTVSNGDGCESSASGSIYVDACLNINNNTIQHLQVFPNPAKEQFNIQVTRACNMTLFSAEGKEILSGRLSPGMQTISVSSLSNGIYFIRLSTEEELKTIRLEVSK